LERPGLTQAAFTAPAGCFVSASSHVAAMRMRRRLRIPKVPWRGWGGTPRPCPVPREEVLRRYYARLGMEPPQECEAMAAPR
jgi:hypothetical protein